MFRIWRIMTLSCFVALTGCGNDDAVDKQEVADRSTARMESTTAADDLRSEAKRESEQDEKSREIATGEDSSAAETALFDEGANEPDRPQETDSAAQDRDSARRATVAEALQQVGSDAALERRAASDTLDELGEAAIPLIAEKLREGSLEERRGAATYMIGRVSPRDESVIQGLIEALRADDERIRRAALQALEKTTERQLIQALPALVDFAKNPAVADAYRVRAIRAISKLGERAASATGALIDLARHDEYLAVRKASLFALSNVAPAEKAEEFYQAEISGNQLPEMRRLAVKWLADVARSPESIDSLIGALNDPDKDVRLEAVDALVALGRPALPALIEAMESSDVVARRHAVVAVGKLGVLARDAAPALRERLDDSDEQVRKLAAAALELVGN